MKKKPKVKSERKMTEAEFDLLGERLLISNLDDVLKGRADDDTIRYHAGMLATKVINYKDHSSTKERNVISYLLFRISKCKKLSSLLGINSKRKTDKGVEMVIALKVFYLIKMKNHSIPNALTKVAATTKKTYDSVYKIYYKNHKEIKSELKAILKS